MRVVYVASALLICSRNTYLRYEIKYLIHDRYVVSQIGYLRVVLKIKFSSWKFHGPPKKYCFSAIVFVENNSDHKTCYLYRFYCVYDKILTLIFYNGFLSSQTYDAIN